MFYNIIIEPEAFSDLLNIKTYITEQDTQNKANQFISELKNTIKTLIYKKYTIVFKIIDAKVHVLTIFKQRVY